MVRVLFILILVPTLFGSLVRPWIGVMAYYTLAIFGPQYVWPWGFEGLRESLLVGAFALVGIGLATMDGRVAGRALFTPINFWMLFLYLFILNSYLFGPYIHSAAYVEQSAGILFERATKIFLFYFCATLVLNDARRLRYFSLILIITTVYMCYWANTQYLSGNLAQFSLQNRLMGPFDPDEQGIYRDENAFGLLFATGLPFLYYGGLHVKSAVMRYALWAVIPLGWHSIFLTGSRGALIALGATLLWTVLHSKRKALAVLLIPIFVGIFVWQGGDVMKSRQKSIIEYEGESSAEARLSAWRAAISMGVTHPISGVGLGAFQASFSSFSPDQPRVAHNTFFQHLGESGIGAAFSYLLVFFLAWRNSIRVRQRYRQSLDETGKFYLLLNEATMASLLGLFTCSLFISTGLYEVGFYLFIINNALWRIASESAPAPEPRREMAPRYVEHK